MTLSQKATYQYFFVVLLTVKNVPYLSFNVSSTKVRIEDTVFFSSPSGNGTAILRSHPRHTKV